MFRLAFSLDVILSRAVRRTMQSKQVPRHGSAQSNGTIRCYNPQPPHRPARQHYHDPRHRFSSLKEPFWQKQPVVAVLAIVFCCLSLQLSVTAQDKETRRVLIVYEVGPPYPVVDLINEGIKTTLGNSRYRIEFYREYMETVLFSSPADQQLIRDYYVHKYQSHMPDVIITVGPSPLRLMIETQRTYFPGVPVIFCLPARQRGSFIVDSDFTGVESDTSPAATLETALRLLPGTKHLFVVGGTSPFDRQLLATVREQIKPYEKRLDISYLTDLTMAELLDRLKRLPKHAVILLTSLGKDGAGTPFTASESGPMIVAAANAPAFTLSDRVLNHGEVGGKVASAREQGKIAGAMALRILNGEKPQDIPRIESAAVYMFDWSALKRWGLDERRIPPGSIVFNRQPSIWESYKWYILGGIHLILLETVLILGLTWQRARRRKTEAELRSSEEKFSKSFRQSPLAITIFSISGDRYIEVNRTFERQTGWKRDELIGRSPRDINLWLDPSQRSLFIKQLLAEGKVQDFEVRFRTKDGRVRTALGSADLIDISGEPCALSVIADITERKEAEEALARLSGRLIEAQEKERKRIARELHDDYNQRLAMLAIDIEKLGEDVGDSSVEASQRLHELYNRVSELGADLHSLSHSLHSSTLESLGLVAGVKAFCQEFAEQQGIQVDFAHENVPRGIPGDAALCIFRIAQEGLRNIKRHSGANRAEVQLEWSGVKLHLSVSDRGRGFDPNKPSANSGIGIRSMEERLRLLGGQLEIHSRPLEGTTIDAWLPFKIASQRAS
jgi:PAS domain S-box-containing protein